MRDPKYLDLANECERRYWPWNKLRIIAQGKRLNPELVWLIVAIGRGPQYRYLPAHGLGKYFGRLLRPHQAAVLDASQVSKRFRWKSGGELLDGANPFRSELTVIVGRCHVGCLGMSE